MLVAVTPLPLPLPVLVLLLLLLLLLLAVVPVLPLPAVLLPALLPVALLLGLEVAGVDCLSAAPAVALGNGRMISFSGLKVGYDEADDDDDDDDDDADDDEDEDEETPLWGLGSVGLLEAAAEAFVGTGAEPLSYCLTGPLSPCLAEPVFLTGSTTATSVHALRSPSMPPGKSSIARMRNS